MYTDKTEAYRHDQPRSYLRLLRLPAVLEKVGLRRSRLLALVKLGRFPPPVDISDNSVGWLENEIDQWIKDRIAVSRGGQGR